MPRSASRPRPARARPAPVAGVPVDPLIAALKDHAGMLYQSGVSYRTMAQGARIPNSTLSDLMGGRRVHLTVADARALANYLHLDIVLAPKPLVPVS